MSKFKFLLKCIPIASTLVPAMIISGPIEDETIKFKINSDEYGPYEFACPDSTISFSYSCNKSIYVQERFLVGTRLDNYTTSYSLTSKSLLKNSEENISFNFPTSRYLSNNGMYCCLRFINPNDFSIYINLKFVIYPISNETLNINDYRQVNYQSNYVAFKIVDSTVNYMTDELNFVDYKNYVDVDNYYRLIINNSYFYYDGKSELFGKAVLRFDDIHNLFPNLIKTDDLVSISLKFSYKNRRISLDFKRSFYINPQTLEMSSRYKTGYIISSNFYFPINKLNQIKDYVFNIEISEFGYNNLSFSNALSFDVEKSYYGTCVNGNICIVGGIDR